MQSDQELHTPEMEHAERELDGRIAHAMRVIREVEDEVEAFEQKVGEPERPTDEDVERIKNFVLGHARTDEWQPVIDQINQGKLTWREVVEGLANRTTDPQLVAAFSSLSKVPPASVEKLIEIGVFPADPPGATPAEGEAAGDTQRRPAPPRTEEEVFDDPLGRQLPPPWRS